MFKEDRFKYFMYKVLKYIVINLQVGVFGFSQNLGSKKFCLKHDGA